MGATKLRKTSLPSYRLAILIGVFSGFFIVFNSIFSDVTSPRERIGTFILVTVVYALSGALFGFLFPKTSWSWGIHLSVPAIFMVVLYSFHEPDNWPLHLLYLVLTLAASSLAATLTARLRTAHFTE